MSEAHEIEHAVPAANAAGAAWTPLLTGAKRGSALAVLESLCADIAAAPPSGGASLSSGAAGLAVFYAELASGCIGDDSSARAESALGRSVELVASTALGASLYSGFTGVAWAAEIAQKLRTSEDDVNEDIDAAVLQVLDRVDWRRAPFDVIYGLTGLGVYAAERMPRPAAAEALLRIVRELGRLAREDEHGIYWWSGPEILLGPRREQYPDGGVDLGVAHGVAGVIPFLAQAAASGVAVDEALTLGGKAVAWLLAHAIEGETGPTIPYFHARGARPTRARLAWCYGDPGVAAALMAAGTDASEPAWIDAARSLARAAAGRDPESSGVTDTGFCHGSAGLAHLFNRMYQATRESWLREVAVFWLERTLDQLRAADGAPAYNGVGLLEGAAGVGLVLHAAVSGVEPYWDRMYVVAPRRDDARPKWPEAETDIRS